MSIPYPGWSTTRSPPFVVSHLKGLASCLWKFLEQSDAIHGPDASFNDRELTMTQDLSCDPPTLSLNIGAASTEFFAQEALG